VAAGSDLFAYLLNNYWHTNYKADQAGPMTFRFLVRPHGVFDPSQLRRLGAETEQPLLVVPAAESAPLPALPFSLDSLVVVASAVRPADDGRGLIVRLYNPTPTPALVRLQGRPPGLRALTLVTGGAPGQPVTGPIRLPAFGTVVVRVERVE
jgi:alpha-mannosidase